MCDHVVLMFFLKGLKLGPSLQDKFQAFNEHEKFSTREIKEGECICFILQYNKIYILQYYISHYNLFLMQLTNGRETLRVSLGYRYLYLYPLILKKIAQVQHRVFVNKKKNNRKIGIIIGHCKLIRVIVNLC
jgi:hypothetical protein